MDNTSTQGQSTAGLEHRYDFIFYFDVENGNPNGDPDAGNLPRVDPETMHGFVTDVSIKRKIRNYITMRYPENALHNEEKQHCIYVKEKAVLNNLHEDAYRANNFNAVQQAEDAAGQTTEGGDKDKKGKTAPKRVGSKEEVDKVRAWMCNKYYDVRTFGAVMSTGINAGQVRGPVQFTFASSVEPVFAHEISITRMAVATQKESDAQGGDNRTIGKKTFIHYGLYRGEGFISAPLSGQTGFDEADLNLLWEAIMNMYEHDRSASRGKMALRKLIIFKHQNKFGSQPAQTLFDSVTHKRKASDGVAAPARSFHDYEIVLPKADDERLEGVELIVKL